MIENEKEGKVAESTSNVSDADNNYHPVLHTFLLLLAIVTAMIIGCLIALSHYKFISKG